MDVKLIHKFFKPTKTRVLSLDRNVNRTQDDWVTGGTWAMKKKFIPKILEDYLFVASENVSKTLDSFNESTSKFTERMSISNVIIIVPSEEVNGRKTNPVLVTKLIGQNHSAYAQVYYLGLFENDLVIKHKDGMLNEKMPYPLRIETEAEELMGFVMPVKAEVLLPLDKS